VLQGYYCPAQFGGRLRLAQCIKYSRLCSAETEGNVADTTMGDPGLRRLITIFNSAAWSQYLNLCGRAVNITIDLKNKEGAGPKLKDFKAYVDSNEVPEIQALKADVEKFAMDFPTIGFEKSEMRYKD
jgi:hypothetical protein